MYKLTNNNEMIIENFQDHEPFSSFLAGIAGEKGIPLWAFYVNRGQALAGFGVRDKNSAITEFFPADKSYQIVPFQGFRTFIKVIQDGDANTVFEPFSLKRDYETVRETVTIHPNHLRLDYENEKHGLTLTVEYFTLPQSPLAALVRKVTITNENHEEIDLELVDGLATIFPSGLANQAYKELGNTLKSWFDVELINNKFSFYHLRGSTEDRVDVQEIHSGNFYASMVISNGEERHVKPIYDRKLIFGKDLTLQYPEAFTRESVSSIRQKDQMSSNKVSGGFTVVDEKIHAGESLQIISLIGYGEDRSVIEDFLRDNFHYEQMIEYQQVAKHLSGELTKTVETHTAHPLFDAYVKQSYLDNGLRGGFPTVFESEENSQVFYLYSRKHGDLERDYNFFSINPTFYSQGNGNYRDINQNRRLDVLFNPKVKDYNIRHFVNLIQLDGYNPLVVNEVRFLLSKARIHFANYGLSKPEGERMLAFLNGYFTPGDLLNYVRENRIGLTVSFEKFMTDILASSEESLEADHGEGFWIDHWTYNLDLVDSFLSVYPDKEQELFFRTSYRFYNSPANVTSRKTKYVNKNGRLRQYDAIQMDNERIGEQEQWIRAQYGKGPIYETTLFSKLFLLAVTKTATIAPYGLGIEMEAGKPGWNDALNGLPGMFGASTSELFELKRLIRLLRDIQWTGNECVILPAEARKFITGLKATISQSSPDCIKGNLDYWNEVSSLRELYRGSIRHGISGESIEMSSREIMDCLCMFYTQVETAIQRVETFRQHELVPTYFYFEAQTTDHNSREVLSFKPYAVTPFLEGIVKELKVCDSKEVAKKIYNAVRNSSIYDRKLGMYKTSMSIANEPVELGRAKFFTPGWLENESVFLHMEYKYLLEVLKNGLTEQFFRDMESALVPFLDPVTYGRSTLENSSFIVSSANPDASLHGRGFVARLSGSTVEFLHMWVLMFIGKRPFTYTRETGLLQFRLQPMLPSWLFKEGHKEEYTVSFTLFSNIEVTYKNGACTDTFGENGVKPFRYTITYKNGQKHVISGSKVIGLAAEDVRKGVVATIVVELK